MDADTREPAADPNWVVDLINEYSMPTRAAAGELGNAPSAITGGPPEIDDLSPADLVAVANGWFEVFRAAPDPVAISDAVNQLLANAQPMIGATSDGAIVSAAVDFADSATDSEQLSARGALALLEIVAEIGAARIGICRAENCVDVYIDRSPRRNRRFCSQLCQTRERVQRHRKRARP